MIISRDHICVAVVVAGALAVTLAWQVHRNTLLRADAAQISASMGPMIADLEKQIVAETQRLASAEASVSALRRSATSTPTAPVVSSNAADMLREVLARAKQLIADGKPQEALEEYMSCYRELQALRPGSAECQSLMSAIQSLGRKYPPGVSALAGLRDSAMAQRQAQPDRRELVFEIALLNERLGEGRRTIELYDTLPPGDLSRQSLASSARTSFIEAPRYADALVGKPVGQMLRVIEADLRQMEQRDAAQQAAMRKSIITETLTNIEVLTGAGKFDDARVLTEKLFVFDSSEDTHAALKQHLERAQPAP